MGMILSTKINKTPVLQTDNILPNTVVDSEEIASLISEFQNKISVRKDSITAETKAISQFIMPWQKATKGT